MIVNVQVPVVHTPDGVVVLARSRFRLWDRKIVRCRAVRFTRVVALDRDTPSRIAADVARRAVDVMHAHYARLTGDRPAEVRVRVRYV